MGLRKETGKRGEKIAEKFLKKKGMKPVDRNYSRKTGEIDLLMMDGEELVVVEVRTVHELYNYDISDKFPVSKRNQLVRVANHLLSELEDPLPPVRFDVCLVVMNPEIRIHHLEDAFRP